MTCSCCKGTGRKFYIGSSGDVDHDICDCQLDRTPAAIWSMAEMPDTPGFYFVKLDGKLICSGLSKALATRIITTQRPDEVAR